MNRSRSSEKVFSASFFSALRLRFWSNQLPMASSGLMAENMA